jgi:hypothetical protein
MMKTVLELVQKISDDNCMGQVCSDADVRIGIQGVYLTISWDALFDGKHVRQNAMLELRSLCFDVK